MDGVRRMLRWVAVAVFLAGVALLCTGVELVAGSGRAGPTAEQDEVMLDHGDAAAPTAVGLLIASGTCGIVSIGIAMLARQPRQHGANGSAPRP